MRAERAREPRAAISRGGGSSAGQLMRLEKVRTGRGGTGSGRTPLSIDAGPELCFTGALPGVGARLLGFTQLTSQVRNGKDTVKDYWCCLW
jgi:hypothetical protein